MYILVENRKTAGIYFSIAVKEDNVTTSWLIGVLLVGNRIFSPLS